MADWLGVNAPNIAHGWGPPPELRAAPIGDLVAAILRDKLAREKMTGENIADTIKNVRGEMQSNQFIDALKRAKLVGPEYEAGGVGGATLADKIAKFKLDQDQETRMAAQQGYMKPYYEAQTSEAKARADAINKYGGVGRSGSGVQRVARQLPNGEWAMFTPGEAYKIDEKVKATKAVGELSGIESDEQAAAQVIAEKWGGLDPNSTTGDFTKKPGMFNQDPNIKAQYDRDYAEYLKHNQEAKRVRGLRTNYEKWYRGTLQPGGSEPGGQTDEQDDTPLPQGGATSPPSVSRNDINQVQQAPGITPSPIPYNQTIPTGTPRPNRPPPADTAAGHAPTYGTPAPGGGAQTGDLVPGVSRAYRMGKYRIWMGADKGGWVIDTSDPRNGP